MLSHCNYERYLITDRACGEIPSAHSDYMQIQRFDTNPLITPESSSSLGNNINGPSIIAAPEWLAQPLGRYYCYFANHNGLFIRLAYADHIEGPWQIYEAGTLHVDDCPCVGHIASPDVHIDHERQEIRMYYHGIVLAADKKNYSGQRSYSAISKDGINFTCDSDVLGAFYFRVFAYQQHYYCIAKSIQFEGGGVLQKSTTVNEPFEFGPEIIENMRHAAVNVQGDRLEVFYSKGHDSPERLYRGYIDLTEDWKDWHLQDEQEVLRSEHDYEGVQLPIVESQFGAVHEPAHQLRDPAYFMDPTDGQEYLFYSIAGESGLAGARIIR